MEIRDFAFNLCKHAESPLFQAKEWNCPFCWHWPSPQQQLRDYKYLLLSIHNFEGKERRNENCVALGLEIELSWAVDHHLRFISLVVRVWHDDMNMLASTTAISSSLPIDINSACARWRRRFWSVPRVESSFNLEIMSWKCDSLVAVYSLSKWSLRTARDFSFHSSSLLK